jgi:hypothetical protein
VVFIASGPWVGALSGGETEGERDAAGLPTLESTAKVHRGGSQVSSVVSSTIDAR